MVTVVVICRKLSCSGGRRRFCCCGSCCGSCCADRAAAIPLRPHCPLTLMLQPLVLWPFCSELSCCCAAGVPGGRCCSCCCPGLLQVLLRLLVLLPSHFNRIVHFRLYCCRSCGGHSVCNRPTAAVLSMAVWLQPSCDIRSDMPLSLPQPPLVRPPLSDLGGRGSRRKV